MNPTLALGIVSMFLLIPTLAFADERASDEGAEAADEAAPGEAAEAADDDASDTSTDDTSEGPGPVGGERETDAHQDAFNQRVEPETDARLRLRPVHIIGDRPGDLAFIPGSASVITNDEIRAYAPRDANEILRTQPGVHVVDEEGIGLRVNIGFRGLSPDKSRNVLVLEDGIPVALNPYGEPEMYYSPPIERIESIEIVRGSGSILFGPQTIGGVVNYRTHAPPQEREVRSELRLGSFNYAMANASVGNTVGQVGYLLHAAHRNYTGPRNTNLRSTDVMGRFRLEMDERTSVDLKLNVYDEISNSTYIGLTTPQFETNPRFNFAVYDVLPVRRYGASATIAHLLSDTALLQTTVYGYTISRNWQRQDFDRAPAEGRTYERAFDGQGNRLINPATGPDNGSGIFFRDSTGNRNRSFAVAGIEPRLTLDWSFGNVDNELTTGFRLHYEYADEQRIDGTHGSSRSGVMREDQDRTGHAMAAYALNRFIIADRLRISPGFRFEYLTAKRTIHRQRVDGTPTDLNPAISGRTETIGLIPGVGVAYDLVDDLVAFTGVHRGFAPPRTKDAVTNDGSSLELDAEFSWNYELGLRYAGTFLGGEIAGFLLDFDQQIIAPSESSGVSEAALVNSGETRHLGVELAATVDAAVAAELGFRLPLTLSWTFVDATFRDGWNEDISGNRLPYAPQHLLNANLRIELPVGLSAMVNVNHTSDQFHDRLETEEPSVDGTNGLIEARTLLDARVGYTWAPSGLTFYVSGRNLTDHQYIASRRPQGIQPGAPRLVFAGISGHW